MNYGYLTYLYVNFYQFVIEYTIHIIWCYFLTKIFLFFFSDFHWLCSFVFRRDFLYFEVTFGLFFFQSLYSTCPPLFRITRLVVICTLKDCTYDPNFCIHLFIIYYLCSKEGQFISSMFIRSLLSVLLGIPRSNLSLYGRTWV